MNFLRRALWLLFLNLATHGAFGSEVLRVGASQTIIAISHEKFRKWVMNDPVCIFLDEREIACGTVVKVTDAAGLVKLGTPSDLIARGQVARLSAKDTYNPQRKPSAILMQSVPKDKESSAFYHNLSGGFSVGNGFYFPLLHFQRMISPQIALGIMPSYFSVSTGSGTLSAFATAVTANYYGHDFFRGLWIQSGLGVSFLSTSAAAGEQQATSFLTLLTVGWRGYWDLGFNIGVCAGIQYLNDPNFNTVRLSGAGLQPLALIDVGFNF